MSYVAVLDNGDSEDVGTIGGWPAFRKSVPPSLSELRRLVDTGESRELGLLLKDALKMQGSGSADALVKLLRRRSDAKSIVVSDGIGEDDEEEFQLGLSYNPDQARDESGKWASALGVSNMKHSVKLPKSEKRMTIQHAGEALRQMGVKLGPGRFDHATGKTVYTVTRRDGKAHEIDAHALRKLVYGSARNSAH